MLALIGALVGALWGGFLAKKRGGSRADMAQYAAGYGIFWGLVMVFVSFALIPRG